MFRERVLSIGLFLVQLAVLNSCGDDPVGDFSVFAIADKTTLSAGGGDQAQISIQVADSDNQAADSGSRVSLYSYDKSNNEPYGIIGDTATNQSILYLDTTGSAATTFTCSDHPASAVIAITHDSNARTGVLITCQ